MTRDILRAALVIAVLAVASALLVETRLQLASIDLAHRVALHHSTPMVVAAPQAPPNRIRRLGQATIELANSALEVVR